MQASPLSDAEYRRLTDELLARIEATTDRWLQDDLIDIDGQRDRLRSFCCFVDEYKERAFDTQIRKASQPDFRRGAVWRREGFR